MRLSLRLLKAALRVWELKQPDKARISWFARHAATNKTRKQRNYGNPQKKCMKSSVDW